MEKKSKQIAECDCDKECNCNQELLDLLSKLVEEAEKYEVVTVCIYKPEGFMGSAASSFTTMPQHGKIPYDSITYLPGKHVRVIGRGEDIIIPMANISGIRLRSKNTDEYIANIKKG